MKQIKLGKSTHGKLPDAVRDRAEASRRWAAEHRDELTAHGREVRACRELMQQLRARRERQGLSLSEVSERVGIDKGNLSRLEQGKGNPTLSTITRVASALSAKLAVVPDEAA